MSGPEPEPESWRRLIAVGLLANDLSVHTVARYGAVEVSIARAALDRATTEGIVIDGEVSDVHRVELIGELSPEDIAEIHASIARHLMAQGPSRLLDAVDHLRAAGGLTEFDELATLAEHAGRTSLSIGDHESARELLSLADSMVRSDTQQQRSRRLIDLASALDGVGHVLEARDALARAFDIATLADETSLAVEAAVSYAMPADWYAGDLRASALLQRAEALPLTDEQRVVVDAARALVEMRIPIAPENQQQVAWVTRASIAQSMSERALDNSVGCSAETRLVALVSWRSTHRTPALLPRRREVSSEALDLSQFLRHSARQVDAAVMLAVDSLESADRPQFDHALSVLQWIAERTGNPRFGWHAHSVAAGVAHMEGDVDVAEQHQTMARKLGESIDFPGWLGAELILTAQAILARGDRDEMARNIPPDDSTALLNPLAKATIAYARALLGDHDASERLLRKSLLGVDEEASYLLNLTIATAAAVLLDVPDVLEVLAERLLPYADHVAVDSNAWWCDGPVALALASLAHRLGEPEEAWKHLHDAEAMAKRMGDARSLDRITRLRTTLGPETELFTESFTEREREVLRLLVSGESNREIASLLNYSPSTIRNDVASIYRKLGVSSRPAAAAAASSLNLV